MRAAGDGGGRGTGDGGGARQRQAGALISAEVLAAGGGVPLPDDASWGRQIDTAGAPAACCSAAAAGAVKSAIANAPSWIGSTGVGGHRALFSSDGGAHRRPSSSAAVGGAVGGETSVPLDHRRAALTMPGWPGRAAVCCTASPASSFNAPQDARGAAAGILTTAARSAIPISSSRAALLLSAAASSTRVALRFRSHDRRRGVDQTARRGSTDIDLTFADDRAGVTVSRLPVQTVAPAAQPPASSGRTQAGIRISSS